MDHAGGIDAGHSVDIGSSAGLDQGMDINHSVDAHQHADSSDTPSPFNPLVISSAITSFGAVGLISMKGFGLDGLMSTVVALGMAGVIGAAIFFGIVKFMYGSQSNSIFSLNDLIDLEAEVLTPIPAAGLGEVAYSINGMRYTLSARSLEGNDIRRGASVVIREVAGNVAAVQQKVTLDEIELSFEDHEKGQIEKPRRDAGNN